MRDINTRDGFPTKIFLIYIFFYAGQAMYNTYLNLFLVNKAFSMTAIGAIQSVSTVALVLIQPVWGIISDKSKSKNQIIGFLCLVVAAVCMLFYAFNLFLWFAFCIMMFTVFFFPTMTLQDNYALEFLEKSRWDFGHVRLGGTLGYAFCAMLVGFIIGNSYGNIFWIMSIFFLVTGFMYFTLPRIEGHRKKHEKVKYAVLLKDKPLLCMLVFSILYYMGISFYFQFYPVYYTAQLGASSQMVGVLSFVAALSEVPFFWYAYKIEKKFGIEKVMMFAGIATSLRWFLLFFVTDPYLILAINLLSGCGYVGFSYCLIKYINDTVPKSMRATAQSFNAILSTIFSRIIFAPLGGVLSDRFGVKNILAVSGAIMLAGVIFFGLTFKKAGIKKQEMDIKA
ncbi:MAG: MFS transporter [Clostridia bacterium]|nr:MFS transporter [Clostridia bacterium]